MSSGLWEIQIIIGLYQGCDECPLVEDMGSPADVHGRTTSIQGTKHLSSNVCFKSILLYPVTQAH